MKVFVTGAGGLIGRALVARLLADHHEVVALVRSPRDISYGHDSLQWVLGDVRDKSRLHEAMRGADYVVHLAARKADQADSREVNVTGTDNIMRAAEACGVRGVVYSSTISVKQESKSVYGKTKRDAEDVVASSRVPSVVLALSVVYSDLDSGIFGSLSRFAKLPMVPVVGPGSATYRPIFADDVAQAIECICERPMQGSVRYELGGPDVISLNDLIQVLSWESCGKAARTVHIPIWLGYVLATVFSVLPRAPLTRSSIASMLEGPAVDSSRFIDAYGFRPRSLQEGLKAAHKMTRAQSRESAAIMRYIAREPVGDYYVELYDRALRAHGLPAASLRLFIYRYAFFLGSVDAITRFARRESIVRKKLSIAAAIYESSPLSARALLPRERSVFSMGLIFVRAGLSTICKTFVGALLLLVPGVIPYES